MKNLSGTAKGWIETSNSITTCVEQEPREIKPLDLTETFSKIEELNNHLETKYKEHHTKEIYDALILLTAVNKSLKQ